MSKLLNNRLLQFIFVAMITMSGTMAAMAPHTFAAPSNEANASAVSSILTERVVLSRLSDAEFAQQATDPDSVCFAETGNCITGRFKEYFAQNGDVRVFGFPISAPFIKVSLIDGKPYTVQYFERNLFEMHPENAAPNDVLLAQLGRLDYAATYFFINVDRVLELYYGKFTTSPNDPGPFVTALNQEFDNRAGHAGETLGSGGGNVPAGSVFWTGGQISGDFFPFASVGGTTVGYARGNIHINSGGRWMRVYGFVDERMMIGK